MNAPLHCFTVYKLYSLIKVDNLRILSKSFTSSPIISRNSTV
uniref:Uncharacterized protein n=1 Tax=Jakoba libera TaxID=143017 RepID=M4QC91_JAKLI|nr:hypothetical protein L048_p072 [Jakoba libera]AGH24184.1 hypothetical protein [Jakoba libera]